MAKPKIEQTEALQRENMRLIQVLQNQVTGLEKATAVDRETLQNLDTKTDFLTESLIPVESTKEK